MENGLKEAAVLCILRCGDELLLLKRTKKLHYGQYVPVGGHIDPFESARAAAIREVREEAGVTLAEVAFCGILQDTAPVDYNWITYVYQAVVPRFDPPACREGVLEWVSGSDLPGLPMPPTDRAIYDLVAEDRLFVLDAQYDAQMQLVRLVDEITGQEWAGETQG